MDKAKAVKADSMSSSQYNKMPNPTMYNREEKIPPRTNSGHEMDSKKCSVNSDTVRVSLMCRTSKNE